MRTLGVRCSNTDCVFAILNGTKLAPDIDLLKSVKFPKGFSKSELLKWFYQEVDDFLKENEPVDAVGIREPEKNARRSNSLDSRIQFEGIISLLSAQCGICQIESKIKSTIAKSLVLKGKGKYLETKLDTSCFDDFDDYNSKQKEAIMVAWSCLV